MIKLDRLKEDRENRHIKFVENLENESDLSLFKVWDYLVSKREYKQNNEYNDIELELVIEELKRRGYVDNLGQVITPRRF